MKKLNTNNISAMVMGDLNLMPNSKPIKYLSEVLNDSKTSSLNKPFGPRGTFNGFKFNEPVTDRIDYIFTSKKEVKVINYAVLSDSQDCKYPSDHLPVFITVEF